MIYGLYLSASGVLSNMYRQDVIANNLANSETVGFKRSFAEFQQRLTEAQARGLDPNSASNELLEGLGGGLLAMPTGLDLSQGDLEETGNPLDVAIQGRGFFQVLDGKEARLTRDGRFLIDRQGRMVLQEGEQVLDAQGRPIVLDPFRPTYIDRLGTISQDGRPVARLGLFDVPDPDRLTKVGGTLLAYPDMAKLQPTAAGVLQSNFVERANVDPATELTQLMAVQRQLEANANMIRYQDQTLGRLVNDVGKIG